MVPSNFEERVAEWHDKKFPNPDPSRTFFKAGEEMGELAAALLEENPHHIAEEAADVALVLMSLVRMTSGKSLLDEMVKKHEIVRLRPEDPPVEDKPQDLGDPGVLRAYNLGAAIHTALRKYCDSDAASMAYNIISLIGEGWAEYLHIVERHWRKGITEDEAVNVLKSAAEELPSGSAERNALKLAFKDFDDNDWHGALGCLFT